MKEKLYITSSFETRSHIVRTQTGKKRAHKVRLERKVECFHSTIITSVTRAASSHLWHSTDAVCIPESRAFPYEKFTEYKFSDIEVGVLSEKLLTERISVQHINGLQKQ